MDTRQLGILVMALLLGGGFAFGGMASYSGIVDSGSNQQEQQFNATMPSSNYQEEPYDMSLREQRTLAYNEDVVFVNAFYETEEQKEELEKLQQLSDSFDNRVYVSVANSTSGSEILISYGLVNFPAAVVNGGTGSSQPANLTVEAVSDAVCDGFRSLGDQSAQCL